MTRHPLERQRRFACAACCLVVLAAVAYPFLPGLPVLWGPRASAAAREAGGMLFEHEWQPNDPLAHGDGLGPVFNHRSCAACHFQGGVGGGGGVEHNVTLFETHPTRRDPEVRTGLVHASAVDAGCCETTQTLQQVFPVIKGGTRVVSGCTTVIADFNPVRTDSVNSTALFGAGWVDRISAKSIKQNRWRYALGNIGREFLLDFNTIPPGRPRVLPDGRLGKFGWKAQAATLEEFVASACANELGLGNPLMEQARPLGQPDRKQAAPDLDRRQFADLVAFVDTLPRPQEVLPDDSAQREQAERGKELFTALGCAVCHTPDLGGVKGVYSDFLLHRVDGGGDVPDGSGGGGGYGWQPSELPMPDDHPQPDEWKTPPLWGVADSAPYFHDGAAATLQDAVLRHGHDARKVTAAYRNLPAGDQEALIGFLKTLRAPADAKPAPRPAVAAVARR